MGLLLATVLGLVVWVVLWATGTKAFDSGMLGLAIVLVAATARTLGRYLPSRPED